MRSAYDDRDDQMPTSRNKKDKRPPLNPMYWFIENPTEFPYYNKERPPIPRKWDTDDEYRRKAIDFIQWKMNSNALAAEQKTAKREKEKRVRHRLRQEHPLVLAKRRLKRDARKKKD